MSALWHPFADMQSVADNEFRLVRGAGVFVRDDAGRRYLDGSTGRWYANVGHGCTSIAAATRRQLAELETFHVFRDFTNRPAVELPALHEVMT